jgi:O-antigen/teichoic acid export membrane protein
MSQQKEKTLSSIFSVSLSTNINSLCVFITGLIINRVIGPTLAGILNFLNLIYSYCNYAYSPFQLSLSRDYPQLIARNEEEKATDLYHNAYSLTIITASIFSMALLACSLFVRHNKFLHYGFIALSLINLGRATNFFLVVAAQVTKKFRNLSAYYILVGLAHVSIVASLTYLYGFYGAIFALGLVEMSACVIFSINLSLTLTLKRAIAALRPILVRGLPLLVFIFVFVNLRQVDRLLITIFMDFTRLGYYGLTATMVNFAMLIPNSIWYVIYPEFMEAGAANKDDKERIKRIAMYNTTSAAAVVILPLLLVSLGVPLVINNMLPAFHPTISVAQILLFGLFFLSIYQMYYYVFILYEQLPRIILLTSFCLLIDVFLNYFFIKRGLGINGVALGTFVSFCLFCLATIAEGGKIIQQKLAETVLLLVKAVAPFCYSLVIFLIIRKANLLEHTSLASDVKSFLVASIIALVLYSPVLLYLNHKSRIITRLLKSILR